MSESLTNKVLEQVSNLVVYSSINILVIVCMLVVLIIYLQEQNRDNVTSTIVYVGDNNKSIASLSAAMDGVPWMAILLRGEAK